MITQDEARLYIKWCDKKYNSLDIFDIRDKLYDIVGNPTSETILKYQAEIIANMTDEEYILWKLQNG